jgi:hypothetical protein
MSSPLPFYSHHTDGVKAVLFFDFVEDLPFPLSMPYHWRLVFGVYLILVIVGGLGCRRLILHYLKAPETKSNPINSLIWMDQGPILQKLHFGQKLLDTFSS